MIELTDAEREAFDEKGFLVISSPVYMVPDLAGCFDAASAGPGTRLGLENATIRHLADGVLAQIAERLLCDRPIAVRAILFRKSLDANWLVPWHQDVTLAAPRRVDLPGAGAWTQKEGVWHVQPPASILENMVALRLHLDPCGEGDGPLKVIPASHGHGRMSADQVAEAVAAQEVTALVAQPGQVIAIRPLLLHGSEKAKGTSSRRVLHVEYCAASAYPF